MTAAKHFYNNVLSDDLQAIVHAQLSKLLPEQLDLKEEVAIQRARCADLVKEWSDARRVYNKLVTSSQSENARRVYNKLVTSSQSENATNLLSTKEYEATIIRARMAMDAAGQRLADAHKEQKDLVLTAATVEAKTREALTERTIMLFLNAAIDLAHELFNNGTKESIQLMNRFERMIRERIVLQEADSNALAIEGEVWAMMQTIEGPNVGMNQSESLH